MVEDDVEPALADAPGIAAAGAAAGDRRRPGRPRAVSPALVGLLRGQRPRTPRADEDNTLRAATGIMVGAATGGGCWALLMLVRLLLKPST